MNGDSTRTRCEIAPQVAANAGAAFSTSSECCPARVRTVSVRVSPAVVTLRSFGATHSVASEACVIVRPPDLAALFDCHAIPR